MIREGIAHVKLCMQLYRIQIDNGRYFLHEHPSGAWSWKLPDVDKLMRIPGVMHRTGHMCPHGMTSVDAQGEDLVLKPTRWMSNSAALLDEVAKRCAGGHRHVQLVNGRARAAAIYPQRLCYAILRGLRQQLTNDRIMNVNNIGTVCEDPEEQQLARMHDLFWR